jgi:hypothetical protein
MGSDLRGRKSADALYTFALAGIQSETLFHALGRMALHELGRIGKRTSFQNKHVLQMMEKIACSGLSGDIARVIFRTGGHCLKNKGYEDEQLIDNLINGNFSLHSDRPLLWLWRHSKRQKKPVIPFSDDKNLNGKGNENICDWKAIFDNPNNDLIVDIGCGMGVSLLGLDKMSSSIKQTDTNEVSSIDWTTCNFLGADLNPLMTEYADGIVSRYSTKKTICFLNLSASDLVRKIMWYPGKVRLIMVQFPSPFRLELSNKNKRPHIPVGNSQLPDNLDGFMISKSLLKLSSQLLEKRGGDGKIFFQTKCEDVAIYVKALALETQTLECIRVTDHVQSIEKVYEDAGRLPQRVVKWLDSTPGTERAEGPEWLSKYFLPEIARTETEVACKIDGSVVHRCLFRCVQNQVHL